MRKYLIISVLLFVSGIAFSQVPEKNKGVFVEPKRGYYQDTILKKISDFEAQQPKPVQRKRFTVDMSGLDFPNKPDNYKPYWHNKPLSQGAAGTCWSFAATSFFESEVFRVTGQKIKLSELYFVYWEYVERAAYFVQQRGTSSFGQGSETTGALRMLSKYGAVPATAYTGMRKGQMAHDHSKMFAEMNDYLQSVKRNNEWNEQEIVVTIKSILNFYMGEPPTTVTLNKSRITPLDFVKDILQFNAKDYFSFISTKEFDYNQRTELIEKDNWWHCDDYYNVSLEDFFSIIVDALENGYTVNICGDVSEPGYDRYAEAGIIPSFDIPAEFIDEDARQLRLYNKSTTDDHCIHIVGHKVHSDGKHWFLIKDSGSGAFDGPNKGYRFIREDYIRLKMMNIMVHKSAARKVLDKIIK